MVADQPIEPHLLAQLTETAGRTRSRAAAPSWPPSTRARPTGFVLVEWPVATGSRAIPTWRPTSSASCSKARRPACRPRPSRRWRSSRTSSRSPAAQIAAIRGVNVDGVMRTLAAARLRRRGRAATRSGPAPCCSAPRDVFLERLGLDSLADLPPLGDFVPVADVVEALERGLRVDAALGEVERSEAHEAAAPDGVAPAGAPAVVDAEVDIDAADRSVLIVPGAAC